jgi:hypothetical protein
VTASRTSIGSTIGIDFGTTNTVIAIADPDGRTEALTFQCGGELFRVYMSSLCFWEERRDGALHTRVEGGPWAIQQFLEGTTEVSPASSHNHAASAGSGWRSLSPSDPAECRSHGGQCRAGLPPAPLHGRANNRAGGPPGPACEASRRPSPASLPTRAAALHPTRRRGASPGTFGAMCSVDGSGVGKKNLHFAALTCRKRNWAPRRCRNEHMTTETVTTASRPPRRAHEPASRHPTHGSRS